MTPVTAERRGPSLPRRATREVLAAPADGSSAALAAGRLFLSEGTVPNHLSAAIQKLNARNRAEAARIAEEKGWLQGAGCNARLPLPCTLDPLGWLHPAHPERMRPGESWSP